MIGAAGQFAGDIVNLSYTGILVQCLSELPPVGEDLRLILHLELGDVEARGKVVRHDVELKQAAVDLIHVDGAGDLLLATLVMAGAGGHLAGVSS